MTVFTALSACQFPGRKVRPASNVSELVPVDKFGKFVGAKLRAVIASEDLCPVGKVVYDHQLF